jgi:threonine dehydrogenase-like Zn-dependent dehydrogenase
MVRVPFMAEGDAASLALIKTLWSGLSRGTERLVFEGRIPPAEYGRMRAPFQEGDFPFPVKYGYCAVGVVTQGPPELLGREVFALHPHQDIFAVPAEAALPLPEGVPARRAILAANMETALNAVWDGEAGPCDRTLVVGAGAVGLLIANILGRMPGLELFVCDVNAGRRAVAESFGARFIAPEEAAGLEADLVFHASGSPAGLATALAACGFEAKVIEASWHGEGDARLPLGGAFHSRRLQIVSSQAGSVAPSRRARWPHRRRLEAALGLLRDDRLDALITHEAAFRDLPDVLPGLFGGEDVIAAAIRY